MPKRSKRKGKRKDKSTALKREEARLRKLRAEVKALRALIRKLQRQAARKSGTRIRRHRVKRIRKIRKTRARPKEIPPPTVGGIQEDCGAIRAVISVRYTGRAGNGQNFEVIYKAIARRANIPRILASIDDAIIDSFRERFGNKWASKVRTDGRLEVGHEAPEPCDDVMERLDVLAMVQKPGNNTTSKAISEVTPLIRRRLGL